MSNYEREMLEYAEQLEKRIIALKEAVSKIVNGEVPDGTPLEQILDDALFEESYSDRKMTVLRKWV